MRHNIALLDQGAAEFADAGEVPAHVLVLAALAAHEGGAWRSPEPLRAPDPLRAPATSPWDLCDGFTPNLPALIGYTLAVGGRSHAVELEYAAGAPCAVSVDGRVRSALAEVTLSGATIAARIDERRRHARFHRHGAHLYLWVQSEQYDFVLDDPRTHEFAASAASGGLTTPLPGVVVAVPVAVGQQVAAGEVLMVIEAMKMEHTIAAPYAGTVAAIHFARGARVPEGSELLSLERTGEP